MVVCGDVPRLERREGPLLHESNEVERGLVQSNTPREDAEGSTERLGLAEATARREVGARVILTVVVPGEGRRCRRTKLGERGDLDVDDTSVGVLVGFLLRDAHGGVWRHLDL